MKLRDFNYWSRWHLDRMGLGDYDIFLYDEPVPYLGFYRKGTRAIALSLPFVLLNSWSDVIRVVQHEASHALCPAGTDHGEEWKRTAWKNGVDRPGEYTECSPEFYEYLKVWESDHKRAFQAWILRLNVEETMDNEGRERRTGDRKGRLRLEFLLNNQKGIEQ